MQLGYSLRLLGVEATDLLIRTTPSISLIVPSAYTTDQPFDNSTISDEFVACLMQKKITNAC